MPSGKHGGSVAFFIPHLGCPNDCIFCDQRQISGKTNQPNAESITETLYSIKEAKPDTISNMQIAFFGGSFTAVDKELRQMLLEAAKPFCGEGGFAGIRFSTRPDCVDASIIDELADYHITDIELGAQSMNNDVLLRAGRGHTAEDTRHAAEIIKKAGYRLTLQMMTGLPGDNIEIARETAMQIADLKPDAVRIYPTLVLQETMLEDMYLRGEYTPQSLDDAINQCAELLRFFTDKGIHVLRVGLHESASVANSCIAGPHHPAFRELCEGDALIMQILPLIKQLPKGVVNLYVRPQSISALTGHNRRALKSLEIEGYRPVIIADDNLEYLDIRVNN